MLTRGDLRADLRGPWVAGGVALVAGLLHLLLFRYAGTDLAAQQARASFAGQHPLTPVDLSWYGGQHVYGYSLLAPWLLSVVGIGLAGLLAAVAGAVLLARLLVSVPASALGGFFAVADVASGRVTFALGAVALLAAVLARERWYAVPLAVLTGLLSPVAAAVLGLVAAVLVLHRRTGGWRLGLGAAVPVAVLGLLFSDGGVQPFRLVSALLTLAVVGSVALLTEQPLVRTGALLVALSVVVLYLTDDPFGSNVQRLPLLVAGPVLLVTSHRRIEPLVLVGCLAWQLAPLTGDLATERLPVDALTAEVHRLGSVRAEVVTPRNHGEVTTGLLLARGWARQVDVARNPLFYRGDLTAPEYVRWLRDNAVDVVAAPRHGPLDPGATREAEVLAAPVPGLRQVWQDADWTVWRVAEPAPVVRGLVSAARDRLVVDGAPGERLVRIRWSRWLSVDGPGCIAPAGEWVALRSTGRVTVTSSLRPHGHC